MEGHCSTGQRPQWAVVPMEDVLVVFVEFCLLRTILSLHRAFYSLIIHQHVHMYMCTCWCV